MFGFISVLLPQIRMWCSGWNALLPVFKMSLVFQEWHEERHREPRLTLRPPSLAAPYAPVQSWHHQPEKLIFESCAYEANVRQPCSPSFWWLRFPLSVHINTAPLPLLQYLGSMLIKDLRGTESTQDACAKMRVCYRILLQTADFSIKSESIRIHLNGH